MIENSKKCRCYNADTQVAVNIQLLLQLLVALIVRLDIL
ncbi:spore coat protein [Anaerobacillus sp. HL2]|nr:spore coat protein [Anaerobacillus sp. HL2]